MAASIQICNRALQKLGARAITSLSEDSTNAKACNLAYDSVRKAELRAHDWNFAITRASLPADSEAPVFGRARSFTLPPDYLKLLAPYPEQNLNNLDWIIEGKKIYTNDFDPLNVRYIYDVDNEFLFDPLFSEALAARLALELCEFITQSNTKKDAISKEYILNIREARKLNAIERKPAEAPDPTWLTARA